MGSAAESGVVNIHGKQYLTVARRIQDFRNDHPDWTVLTEVLSADEDRVVVQAKILDENGRVRSVGHAEEERGSSNINKTSALENAETSAVGRCLALFTYAGSEIASADEVANAMKQQAEKEFHGKINALQEAVRRNTDALDQFRDRLADGDYLAAYEALHSISEGDRMALQVAPTKGGWFTVDEYKVFKSNEWSDARKEYHGLNGGE